MLRLDQFSKLGIIFNGSRTELNLRQADFSRYNQRVIFLYGRGPAKTQYFSGTGPIQ